MFQQVTLAAHNDYFVTLHQASETPSETLVITFGGQPSGLTKSGFGTGWCAQRGLDSIYVAQARGTQYQGLSQEAFFDAVADVASGRDVVCYGSSLGGYAALYFGGCIDARIVAAAPMLPAYPPLRRQPDLIPIKHISMRDGPISARSPILIYDPSIPADSRIVEDMVRPAYPAARYVHIPYAGHTVLNYLARSGQINNLVWPMIKDDVIADVDLPTTTSPIWLFNKGRAIMKHDPEQARHCLESSLALEPAPHVLANLLNLLVRKGYIPAAQKLVENALGSDDPRMSIAEPILARARDAGVVIPA